MPVNELKIFLINTKGMKKNLLVAHTNKEKDKRKKERMWYDDNMILI